MNSKMIVSLSITILLVSVVFLGSGSDAAPSDYSHGDFLIDYGNGETKWVKTESKSTISETVIASVNGIGSVCTIIAGVIDIDGKITETVGGASGSGSLISPGVTGNTVTTSWHIYSWSNNSNKWTQLDPSEYDDVYAVNKLAVGYYPDGMVPTETPLYKSSWTMLTGDSENSVNQWIEMTDTEVSPLWEKYPDNKEHAMGCYSTTLYAEGYAFVKYGSARVGTPACVTCYEIATGNVVWEFMFSSEQMEIAAAMIAGNNIYVQSSAGYLYAFNYHDGPGNNNENVKKTDHIPDVITPLDYKSSYGRGMTAMVFNAGCVFAKDHNGMIYCFDKDLNLIWSYYMDAPAYYSPPTVIDDYVFAGSYDGCLYILDKVTGALYSKTVIYQTTDPQDNVIGSCNTPVPVRYSDGYYLFMTYSDGQGMVSNSSSLAIYRFETASNTLTLVKDFKEDIGTSEDIGTTCNLTTRYVTDSFSGIILATNTAIYTINTAGEKNVITTVCTESHVTHATPVLVNNKAIYVSTYSSRELFEIGLDGTVIGVTKFDNRWYSMAIPTIVDKYVIRSDDNGVTAMSGSKLAEYVPPSNAHKMQLWEILLIILVIIIAMLAALWAVLKYVKKWDKPFVELHSRIMCYFFGENYSHNTKSKRKLHAVILIGTLVTLALAILSLCVGSQTNMGIGEALSAVASSISKGGRGLTYNEMLIYNQRLPRALATIGVGIGLSVAGAMYQAVIKNPLVEPYIMGVSSGAGTLAVAVILADFTFFGLFSSQSIYLTAISAIIGGLLAFGCTMLMAEKTGGKSINYVLAGIVVGLVFSAVQSIMMIQSGTKMSNALSWLYGSFATMSWDKLWLVLIPCISLSLIPLIWAKEFNLVLLGEDQAVQMGLNAKRFDRIMLIIASVLTAFCVAFCGIIGFVGLVVPHLARMIMGGDHRLMLPVSMAFGGSLMVLADMLARVLLTGFELPVGAITTIIGVPVFAYLFIKSGGKYDA